MWQFDFEIYYKGGLALLQGGSPYAVEGWFHPLPMAFVFLPFALFPQPVAYGLYLALCVVLLWRVLKWNGAWVLASFPGFFTLFVGQVDLPFALITSLAGHWALPLLLSRPHLAFVVFPYLLITTPRKELLKSIGLSLAVLAVCFMVRPNWLAEWYAAASAPVTAYQQHDSNLYWLLPARPPVGVVAIISVAILLLAGTLRERRTSWTVTHLFSPVTNIYSAAALAEWYGPLEMLVSWAAILIAGDIHHGAPMFAVGLTILLRTSAYPMLKQKLLAQSQNHRDSD